MAQQVTPPALSGFCNPGNPDDSHARCHKENCPCPCGHQGCSFRPTEWGEWPGIDGMVILCNTHRHPATHPLYDKEMEGKLMLGICQAQVLDTLSNSA